MKKRLLFLVFSISFFCCLYAQRNYTANDTIARYEGYFLYGSNMAWKNNNWSDEMMGNILCTDMFGPGPNANSLRPAMYDRFVTTYGYNFRLPTFQHYASIGSAVNTIFLSGPSEAHRDSNYCAQQTTNGASFKNLYEPIWVSDTINGGLKVNEDNYFAQYVYEVVSRYKTYTKFWEILNEPDFTYNGNGDKVSGSTNSNGEINNWWDADPSPCELFNLRAPVQHYVRMLRIAYEVIKSIDEDAQICTGGLGYASFLDAVMRNTDNPNNGLVTADYPLKGGAYFDCISYHIYPMYYLRKWVGYNDAHPDGFEYFRTSDNAVNVAVAHQLKFENVLASYGYDGSLYPAKDYIITETNIPNQRVAGTDVGHGGFKHYIGSQIAQRNYVVKEAVTCQKNNVKALYIYCPYDNYEDGAVQGGEYDYQGFYKPLPETPGETLRPNESAIAWRTMKLLLEERKYDKSETERLNLPDSIDGGAFFSDSENNYIYVLWYKALQDLNESGIASYSFPASMDVASAECISWNNTTTNVSQNIIPLSNSPIFVKITPSIITQNDEYKRLAKATIKVIPNPADDYINIELPHNYSTDNNLYILSSVGQIIKNVNVKEKNISLNIKELPSGIYFIHCNNNTAKFIKK